MGATYRWSDIYPEYEKGLTNEVILQKAGLWHNCKYFTKKRVLLLMKRARMEERIEIGYAKKEGRHKIWKEGYSKGRETGKKVIVEKEIPPEEFRRRILSDEFVMKMARQFYPAAYDSVNMESKGIMIRGIRSMLANLFEEM